MSHFYTLVLVRDHEDIESQVESLLAPYDENTSVPPYERQCSCVGSKAREEAREQAQREYGTMEELKAAFRRDFPEFCDVPWGDEDAESAWRAYIKPYKDRRQALFEAHPDKDKPNPACDCEGTGKYLSTYNPLSKWDWWSIGGRWTGKVGKNLGPWDSSVSVPRNDLPLYLAGDARPVSELPSDTCPFAVVTPDGEWHERGSMGWWAIVSDGKEKDEWRKEVEVLLSEHQGCIAVVVDCHI